MKKKSIAALAIAATMTLGVGASSYAWFTSSATSSVNTFKSGILGLTKTQDTWGTIGIDLNNMECSDSRVYTYEFNNNKKDDPNNKPSSLTMVYKNDLTNVTGNTHDGLLEVARFDVQILGTQNATSADANKNMTYTQFLAFMNQERTLNPEKNVDGTYKLVTQTYKITVSLPNDLVDQANVNVDDNLYQDKSAGFMINTSAKQFNGQY